MDTERPFSKLISIATISAMALTGLLLMVTVVEESSAETFSTTDHHVNFTDVSSEAGLQGMSMTNCAWGDYDNDGYQDLLLNGYRLFRNNGPPGWDFTDVTGEAGLAQSYSGVWGDYDNDGYLDIFQVTSNSDSPDKLWHNNGDRTFTDVTTQARIVDNYNTPAAGWGDYDGDGFIDLYIANYEGSGSSGSGATDEPLPDFLWHNNGDGTFTDVSDEAGIRNEPDHCGRGMNCGDYDNDGDLDIYISNYRLHPNLLWENQGDGTFINVAEEKGVEGVPRSDSEGTTRYGHTIGSVWGDMDNDGDIDLFVANLVHKDIERGRYCDDSKMYENLGQASNYGFRDLRPGCGMPFKEYMGGEDELWSDCAWGDVDNDGFLDLFITSVYTDIDYAHTYLYMNNGDNTFTDIALSAGVRVWASWGCSMCDYDQDGDLDIVVGGKDGVDAGNNPSRLHLFRNDGMPHSWLEVEVVGSADQDGKKDGNEDGKKDETGSNRADIGARVTVTTKDGISRMREVEGGKGTCANQNSLEVEFGSGRETRPVDVDVRFPTGNMFTFRNVRLNQKVIITERSGGEKAKLNGVYGEGGSGGSHDNPPLIISPGLLAGGIILILFGGIFLILAGGIILIVISSHLRKKGRFVNDMKEGRSVLTMMSLLIVILISTSACAGCFDDDDDSDDDEIELPPLPPDYEAMVEEMGLKISMSSVTFDFSGRTFEDGEETKRLNIDEKDIAFVRFTLVWEDEIDLAPPNPTGDNVVKNMGDTFSLLVETPWGVTVESPGLNNYHKKDGELVFYVKTDNLANYSFENFPGAETGGEFVVHIQCLDCGDQREFGNFGPGQTDLITEDDSNSWDLLVEFATWTK